MLRRKENQKRKLGFFIWSKLFRKYFFATMRFLAYDKPAYDVAILQAVERKHAHRQWQQNFL